MLHGREVRVLLKGQARDSYLDLKKRDDKEAKTILKSFERIKEILKQNPQFGDPLAKDLIPKSYMQDGITNLYRVELSHFWRMIYTLTGNEIEILVFVLNIFDHKDYDKLLGYRRK